MKKLGWFVVTVGILTANCGAMAANPLTADQLLHAIQNALAAEAKAEPDMFSSTSGFRVATVGANAQVMIDMKADGMNMSSKYLCVPQGQDMACRAQP